MNRVIKPVDENSSKPENKLPFKVKNFGLKMHLNMSNCGIRVQGLPSTANYRANSCVLLENRQKR